MNKCSNKNFFVALTSTYDYIFGNKYNYVYPLNKETVLKSQRERKQMVPIDYTKTYIKSFEECKFIESTSDEAVKLEFRPFKSERDTNDKIISEFSNMNEDITNLVLEDNKYFEIIEYLLINNKYLNDKHLNDKNIYLGYFYNTFIRYVSLKDVLFDKLDKRGYINIYLLSNMILDKNPTIEELDKYLPKKFIPTENNYLSIIKKYGIYEDYYIDGIIALATIDPRFAKKVLENKIIYIFNNSYINYSFYGKLSRKNWKCFINSDFVFKNDSNAQSNLNRNPCLIIFYPECFHTEEIYLKALKSDINCYSYLNKKYITPKVKEYHNNNYM
ncbi:hypothetical protein crov021 [Cafeteria roenbergensis virus]|uniref:Uncharacterized protein n=1 Tax=Cafeteria roenbergensis virus (strain BV-PW1) TaxID=693272 RepID=E3T4E1_CROVB|nr:hypothetical protein crov021 [Cafeteria roenbergensis virus BV-PW1]ADO67054.1 hypothetical protein crov021 [Cafeteria roenbergensis virus BV-PW1]